MPKLVSTMLRGSATALVVVMVSVPALAQQSPTVRIREIIKAVNGPVLSVKTRERKDLKVRTTDNVASSA